MCWERDDAPLEVMPLASFVPLDGVCVDGDLVEGIMGKESPPSEWVLGKLQSFKEFVGALYRGIGEAGYAWCSLQVRFGEDI